MKNSTKLLLLRIIHSFIIILFIISIITIYYSVFTGYNGLILLIGTSLLILEGFGLIIWRECPLSPLHRKYQDEIGFWAFYFPKKMTP